MGESISTIQHSPRKIAACRTNLPLLAIDCRRWPCRRFRWALKLAFQRRRTKRKWHWKIAQSCRSPTVSARLRYHVSNSVVFVHRAGTLAKGYPLSMKLFSKAEPFPFEKETNNNVVYSSCLKAGAQPACQRNGTGWCTAGSPENAKLTLPIVIHQSLDQCLLLERSNTKLLV